MQAHTGINRRLACDDTAWWSRSAPESPGSRPAAQFEEIHTATYGSLSSRANFASLGMVIPTICPPSESIASISALVSKWGPCASQ